MAFDGVCHVGRGRFAALEQIALQIEASQVFADTFARQLEVLGHVEIQRHHRTLQLLAWEATPAVLVGLVDGSYALTGFRSRRLIELLNHGCAATGGELVTVADSDAPSSLLLNGLDVEGAQAVASTVASRSDEPVKVVPNAAASLAACLPSLSRLLAQLPRVPMMTARSYERWDAAVARFQPCPDATLPGAYRLSGFVRLYIWRGDNEMRSGTCVICDARTVKHLAALSSCQPLLGYDEGSESLYVPLGADLPGLYGRAAVLASGLPPTSDLNQWLLWYHGVPPRLAGRLLHLLMT